MIFEDESIDSGIDRFIDQTFLIIHGENDHFGFEVVLSYRASEFQPINDRHVPIDDGDVGGEVYQALHGVLAVAGFSDDGK